MTEPIPAAQLLPCPFCGTAVSFQPYKRDGLKIECKPCVMAYQQRTLRYSLDWLAGEMAEHWNRRAAPAAPQPVDAFERDAKDAARYRWLREQHWNEADMAVVCYPKKSVKLGFDCPNGQRLDEAIDAALSQRNGSDA